MENTKKILTAMLLILLAASIITPLTTFTASAAPETLTPVTVSTDGNWTYVKNGQITIVFPAGGKKPMFLWWHTNDTDNINVVKFKGLIEYSTYERPYFLWRCQSDALEIKQQIRMMYADKYTMKGGMHVGEVWRALSDIGNFTNLHAPYLPFESSTWTLDPPVNVTQGAVSYLSFNFTLTQVPGQRERFAFAENNIIIRCRFYYTPATVDVHGQYSYTVSAGEFKIDLIIKHWEWNVDKLQNVITELNSVGLNIPSAKAGLALWVNLASINLTKLQMADEDSRSVTDTSYTERVSNAPAMYVEGQMVSVAQNKTGSDETQMGNSVRDRFKITFEKGNATLAGFFKFVPQAIITNGQTYNTTDVTASYVSAGGHLRLFIGFPYFGSKTLEYDPSFGLEQISTWLPTSLLAILVGASIIIAVAVIAVRMRRRTTDIADVR
jgi:hypothetical protein